MVRDLCTSCCPCWRCVRKARVLAALQAESCASPFVSGCRTKRAPPPSPAVGCQPETKSLALRVWGILKSAFLALPWRSPRWRSVSCASVPARRSCRCCSDCRWKNRPLRATCSEAAWACTCSWSWAVKPRIDRLSSGRRRYRTGFLRRVRRRPAWIRAWCAAA